RRAASAVEREIKRRKLEVIRFAFCDQHGVLRGKTLVASEATKAMRAGVTMTSTLLAKDTSHRTVFDVFSAGGGIGVDEMAGAGDAMWLTLPPPAPYRRPPGPNIAGGVVADIYSPDGRRGPFARRALGREGLGTVGRWGFNFFAELEVELRGRAPV